MLIVAVSQAITYLLWRQVGASVEINGGNVYDPLDLLKLHSVQPSVFPHPKWLREVLITLCPCD